MKEAQQIEEYFDRLWGLPRSITGHGVRESHKIISEICPLNTSEIPSGTDVLDWTIPKEWKVNKAYIICPEGKKILNFSENNLHLLNYSIPFRGELTLDELKKHLYTIENFPEAIPYRTSYYKEDWGFCIAYEQYESLKDGNYKVVVDTELFDGSLTMSEAIIEGESDEEVVFTTYTCHPSLAINELSGPLLTAFLYKRIAQWKEKPRLTYRFLFAPETIGAIAYLAERGQDLKEKLQAGYIVTCVGDGGHYRVKKSKRGDTLADRVAEYVIRSKEACKIIGFSPSGSDERQYCSIGYNLPFASISRTSYGEYREYHTSKDNKDLMDFEAMAETLDVYEEIARILDKNIVPQNRKIFGEPQMSKYGDFYRSVDHQKAQESTYALKWLLHYADGSNDLLEISQLSGIDFNVLSKVVNSLVHLKIFDYKSNNPLSTKSLH